MARGLRGYRGREGGRLHDTGWAATGSRGLLQLSAHISVSPEVKSRQDIEVVNLKVGLSCQPCSLPIGSKSPPIRARGQPPGQGGTFHVQTVVQGDPCETRVRGNNVKARG